MKKLFTILALVASLTLLVSCSGNNPENVTKQFVISTNKGDFAEAKKYCDETTGAMLGMAESMMSAEKKEEMKKKDIRVEIVSSEVKEDDTAKVTYKIEADGEDSIQKTVDLKKIDGDWKVSVNKEGR